MKYSVKIVKVGEIVKELLDKDMLILFNENVPEELAEMSVLHTICELKQDIVVGNIVKIGDLEYEVVAVGKNANKTMRELGHCTFKFKDCKIPDLPGVINLKGKKLESIKIGDEIFIF